MTTRTTPSPIEIIADAELRLRAEAGAAVIAFDEGLTTVLFADPAGRDILGTAPAASPALRQIRSAARTLSATGSASVLLRRSTRAGTSTLAVELTLRPAPGTGASFALATIAGLGRPFEPGDLAQALAGPGGSVAIFEDGAELHATAGFAKTDCAGLGARIAAFAAGSQAMARHEEGSSVLTLARAPFGRIVARAETREMPAVEADAPAQAQTPAEALSSSDAPATGEAPTAGFATFSVKRSKLGEARPGMSMGALLQRWHSRGPETDAPSDAEPAASPDAVDGSARTQGLDDGEAGVTATETRSPAEIPAPALAEPVRKERLRSQWGASDAGGPMAEAVSTVEGPGTGETASETAADIETLGADDRAEASDGAEPQDAASATEAASRHAEADAPSGDAQAAVPDAPGTVTAESDETADRPVPAMDDAPAPAPSGEPARERPAFVARFDMPPVRFVWQIDREGAFRFLSPDFAGAVGPNAADVVGRSFATVSRVFGFDETREIARLLERRDTWSGRTIFWPVEGSDRKVPVDLAALPVYGRDRSFDGFRGFGIVRLNESVEDGEALGLHLTQGPAPARDAQAEPAADETPEPHAPREKPLLRRFEAEGFGRRAEPPAAVLAEPATEVGTDPAQKVIRLEERRRPRDGSLSSAEEAAFRAIGAKLGHKAEAESPGALRFEEPIAPEPSPDDAEASATAARGETDGIEPALEALSEKLARAEAEADRRLAARSPSGSAQPSAAEQPVTQNADAADIDEALRREPSAAEPSLLVSAEADAESAVPQQPASPGDGSGHPAAANDAPSAAEDASDEPAALEPTEAAPSTAVETGSHEGDEEDGDGPPLDLVVFERLFAGLPLAVLVQVREHTVYINAEFAALTGHVDAGAVEAAGGLDALVLDRQGEGTLALLRADGEIVEVHGHMQRIAEGGRSALLMSFQRVADEAMAAGPALEDLRQEVEELQAVLDTATDGVVLLDSSGNIRAMNGSAHALFGIGVNEAFGRHLSSLFAHESQKATVDYLEMLRDDGIGGILNDGREVIGRVSQGGFIPLFITIGRLSGERGWCVVIRDIAHWKRIEEDLVNARRQAEAASLHKSRFLANISHELRTPLNAIIGFADVMSSECFGPIGNERYLEYLGDIKRSGHHVLDLVNDLLDISKIEAGKIDLSFEAVALNEVISEAVSLMQPQANRERVIVRSNLPSSVPPVVADRRTMRQIALNLLANAIRFTPAGGQIIASTTYSAEGDVLLRFRDSGIGMTEREIELALTPFQQVHAPSANRGEGTGLGLPLTKAMVEANRAYFSIQSTPGEGTLVEIVFPAPRVLAD